MKSAKIKKFTAVIAATLCGAILASCGGGSSTSFSANWYRNSATNTVLEGTSETLTYSVSLKEESGLNNSYTVYIPEKGVYTAKLTSETKDGELLYRYETSLKYTLQYGVGSEISEKFDNTVTSKVLFRSTQKGLQPVLSEKTVSNYVPRTPSPSTLAECYLLDSFSLVTEYKDGKGTCVYTDLTSEKPEGKSTEVNPTGDYTFLDNEQLILGLRAVSLSATQRIETYYAARKTVAPVKIVPSSSESEKFTFDINGEKKERAIAYNSVAVSLDVKAPGATQTAWIASGTKDSNGNETNLYRHAMLKLENPLPYSLGTMVFDLTSAVFTA